MDRFYVLVDHVAGQVQPGQPGDRPERSSLYVLLSTCRRPGQDTEGEHSKPFPSRYKAGQNGGL